MENETKSIGDRIKQRRKELCLTQTQIHEKTGISSGNMSDIENGNKLPSALALISLSKVLNCSVDWILKGYVSESENIFITDERMQVLLSSFYELPEDDKEEIIEIVHIKLRKCKKQKGAHAESSPLIQNDKTDIVC